MPRILHTFCTHTLLLLTAALTLLPGTAHALPVDTYAAHSRLAEGTWVKVAVESTGVYFIPAATLRSWGFATPQQAAIYGYGGQRISDYLSADTYVDDLPPAPHVTTDAGIWMFAYGVHTLYGPDKDGMFLPRPNPFTSKAYYFVGPKAEGVEALPPTEGLEHDAGEAVTTFMEAYLHERDLAGPGESGHLMTGESLRSGARVDVDVPLTDRVAGTPVHLRVVTATKISSGTPRLQLSAAGARIEGGMDAPLPVGTATDLCDTLLTRRTVYPTDDRPMKLTLQMAGAGTTGHATLDYALFNYTRRIRLAGDMLTFTAPGATTVEVQQGQPGKTVVWDVTDAKNIRALRTYAAPGGLRFTGERPGMRRYVAFNTATTLPAPETVGNVGRQDIHGEATPDMVIFTPAEYVVQARRLAEVRSGRAPDSLRCLVVTVDQAANEFGSGAPDVGALRRLLKMFYDRGTSEDGHRLRYAMMLSRPFYDQRRLSPFMQGEHGYPLVPWWQTDRGHDSNASFGSDDFVGMLEDGSGLNMGSDRICVAVGRLAVRNNDELREYIDKLEAYTLRQPSGDWKNRITLVADDRDRGEHLRQAEVLVNTLHRPENGGDGMLVNKVYLDAYELLGGIVEQGRQEMFKWLNEGSAWWMYIGHASYDTWGGEKILTRYDLTNNTFFSKLPILYAATCSFMHWDASFDSGAEFLLRNTGGGVIAAICPTRKVYISANGMLSTRFAENLAQRDANGLFLSVGDIIINTKNASIGDSNKLRYVLAGDPSMRVPTPSGRIELTEIGGQPAGPEVAEDEYPVVQARQQALFEGSVLRPDGTPDTDFNGTLSLAIYDADYEITTQGHTSEEDPGQVDIFTQHGTRIYAGRDTIADGRFSMRVAMPSEIADNYRPATVNMYATSRTGEAMGLSRRIIVYGTDENALPDTIAPEIRSAYLNHESFKNGDRVNDTPMLFADIADNVGINLSQAGIGHSILMKLDGREAYTDISDYYVPASDGSPAGTILYPVSQLTPGNHTMELRVFDTSNNVGIAHLDFFVQPGLAPEIFDVWTSASPATEKVDFYVRHNRPEAVITVTIDIHDLMGRVLWSRSVTAASDMFVSTPVTWDLHTSGGARVPRGIYVYRCTVSTPGYEETTVRGGRIAVAAR